MEYKQAMQLRAACRAFKEQQISEEELSEVLDGAYLAPVGLGRFEDVRLIVLQNPEKIEKINVLFAQAMGKPDMKMTGSAPTIVIVCMKSGMEDLLLGADAGCLIENMMVAAAAQGLGTCFLYGFCRALESNEEAMHEACIPEGFRPLGAMSLGIPAEEPVLREVNRGKIETIRI